MAAAIAMPVTVVALCDPAQYTVRVESGSGVIEYLDNGQSVVVNVLPTDTQPLRIQLVPIPGSENNP